jgi:hypothetical protein
MNMGPGFGGIDWTRKNSWKYFIEIEEEEKYRGKLLSRNKAKSQIDFTCVVNHYNFLISGSLLYSRGVRSGYIIYLNFMNSA